MTLFGDLMAASGLPVLEQFFGETVTLFPAGGLEPYTVTAQQTGRTKDLQHNRHHQTQPQTVTLLFQRHATLGLTDPGIGWAVRLEDDDPAIRWNFARIVSHSSTTLLVEWNRVNLHKSGRPRPSDL